MRTCIPVLTLLLLLAACNEPIKKEAANTSPDTVYFGGDIITMEGDSAQYAEAVVVRDGKILFVGSKEQALKSASANPELIDLKEQTLLPGFIDAHGHLYMAGIQALAANLLPAPDGKGNDIASLIDVANQWKAANASIINKTGWILGFGYDESQLKEQRHPTAADLDKISKDTPVLFIHQSAHLAVVRSSTT
jgi:hypothetical protein